MAAADCHREKQIANDIKEEFCKRVIPSELIRHLQCLTKDDSENVLEDEEKHGPMHAADVLLQKLVQQPDWLSHLKTALLNPDAGLVDFGERIEQMCSPVRIVKYTPMLHLDLAQTSPVRIVKYINEHQTEKINEDQAETKTGSMAQTLHPVLGVGNDDDDGDSISDDDDGDSISDYDYDAPVSPFRLRGLRNYDDYVPICGYGPSTNRIKHIIINKKPTITHSPQNPPPPPPPPNHPI